MQGHRDDGRLARPAFGTAFDNRPGQFLGKQRNPIGALQNRTDKGLRQRPIVADADNDSRAFAGRQPAYRGRRGVDTPGPGGNELRPEGDDDQQPQARRIHHDQVDELQGRGIGPMQVLDDKQHRTRRRQPLNECQQRVQRFRLALPRRQGQRVAFAGGNLQQIREQRQPLQCSPALASRLSSLARRCLSALKSSSATARCRWQIQGYSALS